MLVSERDSFAAAASSRPLKRGVTRKLIEMFLFSTTTDSSGFEISSAKRCYLISTLAPCVNSLACSVTIGLSRW